MSSRLVWGLCLVVLIALPVAACSPAPAARPAPAPASGAPAAAAASPASSASANAPASVASANPTTAAPAASAAALPPTRVKVATLGIAPEAGMYIALERGYFREEGLEVELIPFQGGAQQLAPLATGELHFGVGGPEPGLFNAAARGVEVRIVGHNAMVTPTDGSAALIVRRDLLDSGRVAEPKDLKGLTIGVNVEKSTSQLYVERILAMGGLVLDDVELKLVPFAEMPVALTNRAVDAAWAVEPFVAVAAAQGLARSLVPMAEAYPNSVTMVVTLSPVFARDEPEAARRFMAAHLRGQRDYFRAFVRDEGGREDIIRILTQHTRIKDPAQYASLGWHGVEPNGALDARVLDDMQSYFVRVGSQTDRLDLGRAVDLQYVNYAVERLGRLP